MSVSRLEHVSGIEVDRSGGADDAIADPDVLRLGRLTTDVRPPSIAIEVTRTAIFDHRVNSYQPCHGAQELREAVAAHVGRSAGRAYDPDSEVVAVAGGLNGILNVLLATIEPGSEVVLCDPVYVGLIDRVRLAGGIPRFVRSTPSAAGWTVDPVELAGAVGPRTAAVLVMSPATPTGLLLGDEHWSALASVLERHDAWLIYDAAMERLRFDGSAPRHPADHPALTDRTIAVGSASMELRLIGWRVGWITGPASILNDVRLVGLTNVICPVGIAQQGVAAALTAPFADDDVRAATRIWRERADLMMRQLAGYPVLRPGGGWSLLVDASALGMSPSQLARRLFDHGRVAATPMADWGPSGSRYLRLVFSNERPQRLRDLRLRFEAALAASG